jgi:hypothetical protein
MQGMAQQMQQMQQGQQGQQGDPQQGEGQQGDNDPSGRQRAGQNDNDPLGRPTRSREASEGRSIQGLDQTPAERARRILDELRRKLGDPTRAQEELEYFDRLLRRN